MQHLEHDRLVFLALGESDADSGESTHLDSCEHCRVELLTLQHVAGLGAGTQGLQDLPDPPEHIWQGIMTEIRAAEQLPSLAEARSQQRADASGTTDGDDRSGGTDSGVLLAPRSHRRHRWSRWASGAVTAVAAAAIGVVGTLAVLDLDDPEPTPPSGVVASAPLVAYGATPPDATGEARVLDNNRLHLHVANLPDVPGYYEVWLINPANMRMFSVGVLGGQSDELLPLPQKVDLESYSVVDVSAETFDNDTAHSGNSLLRGTLTS